MLLPFIFPANEGIPQKFAMLWSQLKPNVFGNAEILLKQGAFASKLVLTLRTKVYGPLFDTVLDVEVLLVAFVLPFELELALLVAAGVVVTAAVELPTLVVAALLVAALAVAALVAALLPVAIGVAVSVPVMPELLVVAIGVEVTDPVLELLLLEVPEVAALFPLKLSADQGTASRQLPLFAATVLLLAFVLVFPVLLELVAAGVVVSVLVPLLLELVTAGVEVSVLAPVLLELVAAGVEVSMLGPLELVAAGVEVSVLITLALVAAAVDVLELLELVAAGVEVVLLLPVTLLLAPVPLLLVVKLPLSCRRTYRIRPVFGLMTRSDTLPRLLPS